MEYTKVVTIEENEIGYFHSPGEGCVDEYRIMAFNEKLKRQQVLSYEDSPGEAEQTIERFVREGFQFGDWTMEGVEEFRLKK